MTIAAVDAGILNLTRFEAPAPERWFYGQRRLGLEIRDFYGRLIDGLRADAVAPLRRRRRGRRRHEPARQPARRGHGRPLLGILKVDKDGFATADFQLPDFNGALRLMAVAWSADKLTPRATSSCARRWR